MIKKKLHKSSANLLKYCHKAYLKKSLNTFEKILNYIKKVIKKILYNTRMNIYNIEYE